MVSNQKRPDERSLVLVTAANGLVASHVVDQLLAAGFEVRGTVRSLEKNKWMQSTFDARFGPGRFSMIEVPDMSAAGAWQAPLEGVSEVAQMLSAGDMYTQDYQRSAAAELKVHIALLEAARKVTSVKSFVFTSSVWAAFTPDAHRQAVVEEWSWNETALEMVKTPNASRPDLQYFAQYMALKTTVEQQVWAYVRQADLPFAFNVILLDTVIGRTLHPPDQGMPSTAGMVKWCHDGVNVQVLQMMQPQWCVDTADTGMLYVAALNTPGLDGARLFACGARYSWARVIEILAALMPEKQYPALAAQGWDQTEVPNQQAKALLESVKGRSWATLEESVEAATKCF